jgi:hypothetical protein
MSLTVEELLPRFLDPDCGRCKEPLPEPGQPCPGCGAVPEHTRAEVEERLAEPGAIAVLEARDLRLAAWQLVDQVRGLLRSADMVEHIADLERERDAIAAELAPARAGVKRLSRELKQAQGRDAEAAKAGEDSLAKYNRLADALKAAQKTKADLDTRTEARMRLNAAGPELEADQAVARAAASEREAAERAHKSAEAEAARLEGKLAAAKHAVANPGRPAKSPITLGLDLSHQAVMIALGLSNQVQDSDLTEDEEAQVRSLAAGVAGLSGASEMIATLAVGAHEKAKAGEYRDQPLYTRPLGPGNLEAVANPVTAGRPLS